MATRLKKRKKRVYVKKTTADNVTTSPIPDATLSPDALVTAPVDEKPSFSPLELREALFYIDDILDRCLANYFVLGQLSRDLHDGMEFSGDKVHLGMLKGNVTKYMRDTLVSIFPDVTVTDNGMETVFRTIPIKISFIDNNYSYFKNPDFRHYYVNSFYIANPFEEYWSVHSQFEQ